MKIIVDAFGGDNAPLEIIKGCALAVDEYGFNIVLVGPKDKIEDVANKNKISLKNMEIVNTNEIITMEDSDKIDGFNIGCDDYVCKPFNVKELVLRVKAVFRKMDVENKDLLKFSDELEIDMNSHEVKVRGKKVELTNTEYKILLLFAKNQNKVFTREQLLELTIEEHYEKIDRVIDAHVKNLRQKIELDTKKATIIKTVYGVGYKFGL